MQFYYTSKQITITEPVQEEPPQEDLYVWTDSHDTFVAKDRDHLKKVFKAHYRDSIEYVIGGDNPMQYWCKVPDERKIVIRVHEISITSAFIPEDSKILTPIKVEASAKSWANHNGPGLLCLESF